jgi:hypothetical protein
MTIAPYAGSGVAVAIELLLLMLLLLLSPPMTPMTILRWRYVKLSPTSGSHFY